MELNIEREIANIYVTRRLFDGINPPRLGKSNSTEAAENNDRYLYLTVFA
jgi:hypothetical protein